ncbi:MAG: glutathione-disulfide reductase [Sandaracinaceae bacterium]|jgi:glutathione reductase (NADPH)|nr:glutathione-disulfide reductase [Sandaracinaceae bacterium]MBK8409447.1 glutathione-disulfide reductase [Sandaracinaceae bacterium]MBK8592008.1 glutathione-disulfide reductase [Sandaracinaceae bacterium]MBP7681995.1 glutathione-disulfide reductase [Deltaproteobacteria bacterium]
MAEYDFDLYVVGAGSGGVRAARMSASMGARVGICEERYMGGTCVNVGCVPKKLFVYASEFGAAFRDAAGFGFTVPTPSFDWPTLVRNKDAEITRLNGIYESLLTGPGATVHHGRGRLVDAHHVEVNGQRFSARHILVATGGRPIRPSIPGAELGVTSEAIFSMPTLPKRALVVGGGYIGLEFASIFEGLGVTVTLVHRGDHVLTPFDHDVRTHVEAQLRARGIDVQLRTELASITRTDQGLEATLVRRDGAREQTTLATDLVLFATGRRANTQDLGLEALGVVTGAGGEVRVDLDFRTNVPSVFALGDVIDRYQLTPVALAEGMALAKTLFGGQPTRPDYDLIPTAVFTQPPVATVGLTEEAARARHPDDVVIFRSTFRPMKSVLSGSPDRALMKLVVRRSTDVVLGCHVVAPDAGEIVQGFAVALRCSATKAQLDATIGIHPTAAEELVTMRTPV